MSNFTARGFEFDLGQTIYEDRIVLVASPRAGERGNGGSLSFHAEQRGVLQGPDIPEHLRGASYSRQLPGSRTTFYSRQLMNQANYSDGELIEALARGEITGRSAENAVWSLFWTLVLGDPDSRMLDGIEHGWLAQLRAESLAQRGHALPV